MKKYVLTLPLLALAFFSFSLPIVSAGCIYQTPLQAASYDMGTLLTWSTQQERNTQFFQLEKSNDGIDFKPIGRIPAAGRSDSTHQYQFLDISATQGRNYYRLRLIDTDERFHLSDIIVVNKATPNNFTVLSLTTPTDSSALFELVIKAQSTDQLDFSILDPSGTPLYTERQQLRAGLNVISIDLNARAINYRTGYSIKLQGINEAEIMHLPPLDRRRLSKQ